MLAFVCCKLTVFTVYDCTAVIFKVAIKKIREARNTLEKILIK